MERNPTPDPLPTVTACRNHPDRGAEFVCPKLEQALCRECARCPRPTHCVFRSQCLIRGLESAEE